jgi:HEAT repeat protein
MGLFDIFKGKAKAETKEGAPADKADKNVARLGKVAGDRHAQNYDRIEAIDGLARVATGDAAAALLRRFTFHIDPSITDQEEKDAAERGILAAGEAAIEPIRTFCLRAESLTWPLKILKEIVTPERYVEELIQLLGRFDTDYTRNVDPKQQIISELEPFRVAAILPAVAKFLEDASDDVRFAAVATVFAQEDPAAVEPLARALSVEESMRVKNRIAEGFAARGYAVPEAHRAAVKAALPPSYALDASGKVRRS